MFDPEFDPYDQLEKCSNAIHDLTVAMQALIHANNLQAEVLSQQEEKIKKLNRSIIALKKYKSE